MSEPTHLESHQKQEVEVFKQKCQQVYVLFAFAVATCVGAIWFVEAVVL